MIGWLVASVFFCLAGIGWWRSEQYRRHAMRNAQRAEGLAALVRVTSHQSPPFLTYEQLVAGMARPLPKAKVH